MKKTLLFLISIFGLLLCPDFVYAEQISLPEREMSDNALEQQLNTLDFEKVDAVIDKRNTSLNRLSLKELTLKAIKGQLDLSPKGIADFVMQSFFSELLAHKNLIRRLIVIGILSAMLNNLTTSFKNKSVGELGFYVSYVALVMVLLSSFQIAASVVIELITGLSMLMEASLPLMLSLMAMSGSVSGAAVFSPVMIFVTQFITSFVKNIFVPVLVMASSVEIVNYLTERELLSRLTKLVKNSASWIMKGIAAVFLGVLSLQKISTPIMDNLAVKTAKASAGAIPVVGGLLGGAVETVLYFASAAKSGVLVALFILIISTCIIPVLEMLAMLAVYKLTAALIQPVCDNRIVECIDSIGSFTALILGCGVTVIVMFLFSVMILLSF